MCFESPFGHIMYKRNLLIVLDFLVIESYDRGVPAGCIYIYCIFYFKRLVLPRWVEICYHFDVLVVQKRQEGAPTKN